jgi:Ca2+/Na+ antiporter
MGASLIVSSDRHMRSSWLWLDAAMVGGGMALLVAVLAGSMMLADDTGEMLTRNTVRLSLGWYAVALVLMMRLRPTDWAAASAQGRLARWCWTWGVVCFLVHLGMAFHYYHHWSHTHAFEHTREVGGIGEGIYVSYLFTWLWVGDAAWWWVRPQQYAARPAWIDRSLHAFMLFIVFNGMVVFESGAIRWAGAVMFVTLACAWLATRSVPGRQPT